jgi:Response regulator containing CheY-like receiver, AAA-type ATPase, and DNA-binding domains
MTVAFAVLEDGFDIREPWMDSPAHEPARMPRALGRVLVVDDDAMLRTILGRMLSEAGYDVVLAADGLEALGRLREDGDVDLVVADLRMPRMGGQALGQELRARDPDLPVLYISGYAADWSPHLADGPASAFMQKPFDEEDFLRSVSALLHES